MWLIAWLVDRYERVLDWFGEGYNELVERVKSLPQTFINWANEITKKLVDWAGPLIVEARQSAIDWASLLHDNAVDLAYSLSEARLKWIADLNDALWNGVNEIRTWVTSGITDVQTWVIEQYTQIETDINSFVDNLLASKLNPFNWLVNIREEIEKLVKAFSDSTLGKLLDFVDNWYDDFLDFIQNPAGYVLAIIKPIFLDLLAYLLAAALGAENEIIPDWSERSD